MSYYGVGDGRLTIRQMERRLEEQGYQRDAQGRLTGRQVFSKRGKRTKRRAKRRRR